LAARLEPTRVEHLTGFHSKGRLLALPESIRLGWKILTMASTLTYHRRELIIGGKSFMIQAPGLVFTKLLTIILQSFLS